MLSVGALIWISIRPLLRLVLCTATGYVLTKADLFPAIAARGTGQILLNIGYPALMFSKIVPAFTADNIGALGPLVLVAVLYEIIGLSIAWIVKQFFWVPHRFRHGILVAGCWSNVGDIPTAIIMSITGTAPFDPSRDQTLSVAYISVFIFVFFVTFFPMGGHRLVAMDFAGPEVDDSEVHMSVAAKTKDSMHQLSKSVRRTSRVLSSAKSCSDGDAERGRRNDIEKGPQRAETASVIETVKVPSPMEPTRPELHVHVSFKTDNGPMDVSPTSKICSPIQSEGPTTLAPSVVDAHFDKDEKPPHDTHQNTISDHDGTGLPTTAHRHPPALQNRLLTRSLAVLRSLCTAQTIPILIAFPVSLITPLKALFTPVPNSPIPNAPDNQPPLAFLLDTTNFIGIASVPLALISLGSALARMRGVPTWRWSRFGLGGHDNNLPLGAIVSLTVGKLVVMPVLGVLMTQGLTHAGVIKEDQKVLQFVCIFYSCLPTATTQVFLTQVYSGTGAADTLAAFLIPQYIVMVVTMTILSAYALSILF